MPPKRNTGGGTTPTGTVRDQQVQALQDLLKKVALAGLSGTPTSAQDMQKLQKQIAALKKALGPAVINAPSNNAYVPFALPESRKAVLMSAFIDKSADPAPTLADMLKSRGYQVEPPRQLTLAALRNLPGQNIGVLYLFSHATSTRAGDVFGFSTQEFPRVAAEETPANIKLLTQDLHSQDRQGVTLRDARGKPVELIRATDNNLVVADANGNLSATGPAVNGYSAKIGFFQKYWNDKNGPKNIFSKNSVVLINACDVVEKDFLDLLIACGAGTILAWDNNVTAPLAVGTANYIFDRLLGTNRPEPAYFPEKLRQRPFTWGELQQDRLHHHVHAWQLGGPYTSLLTDKKATLRAHPGENCPGPMLAPSIRSLRVDEAARRLIISGEFGPDLGRQKCKVSIHDKPDLSSPFALEVVNWDGTKARSGITCILPSSFPGATTPAPGTAGYVVVTVDGRRSNAVPLTEWRGQIVVTARGKDSLQETCTVNFSIRMDAHLYRTSFLVHLSGSDVPAEVLAAYKRSYLFAVAGHGGNAGPSSTLHCEATGIDQYRPPTSSGLIKLSRQGNLKIPPASSNPTDSLRHPNSYFDITLGILRHLTLPNNPALPFDDPHDIALVVSIGANYTIRETTTRSGNPPKTVDSDVPPVLLGSSGATTVKSLQTQSWSLPKPKTPSVPGSFKTISLTFSAETRFPPDLAKGEDYLPSGL